MRKVLYGLLSLMLVLTGCKEKTIEEKQKIRIGISYYDSYDPFIMELSSRIEKQLNAYENVIVKSVDSEKSQSTQNRHVSDMLSDSYDVICVNLVDRTAPKKIISMAEDSNVPVIFLENKSELAEVFPIKVKKASAIAIKNFIGESREKAFLMNVINN